MHYKPCSEIIGGARALLPMEVYAYVWNACPIVHMIPNPWNVHPSINWFRECPMLADLDGSNEYQ